MKKSKNYLALPAIVLAALYLTFLIDLHTLETSLQRVFIFCYFVVMGVLAFFLKSKYAEGKPFPLQSRIAAALLAALLEPTVLMREAEYAGNLGKRMAMLDECKNLPLNAVWDYLCWKKNAGVGMSWLDEMDRYEREVQRKRV